MRAIGFNGGQFGDLAMNTVAVRAFKSIHPDAHFTFAIGSKYHDFRQFVDNHPLIDDVHVWEAYENWPSDNDKKFLEDGKFDLVFPVNNQHTRWDWYNHWHQTEEVCRIYGLPVPINLRVNLGPYDGHVFGNGFKPYVCIAANSSMSDKSIPQSLIDGIIAYVNSKGFDVYHLGARCEAPLPGAKKLNLALYGSASVLLGSRLLICGDTGMNWIASGYRHKVVGLYGYGHYPFASTSKNWQPINESAIYLERRVVEDIPLDEVIDAIDKQLN